MLFMAVVLIISAIVIGYRKYYMAHEQVSLKFIYLVFLFILSMCLIIMRPNVFRILLGWDGLGLVSYALVIYYQNIKSRLSGIITILSNRVGDAAIILRVVWLINIGN
jgi:NADH-ubiquinone oxidoreductase chain 5